MTRLLYIANVRLPTEKAHGLQITQMCEAFADAGADVSLWVAARINTPEMNTITDLYAHYGVKRDFRLRRLPTLDLLPLVPDRTDTIARAIFYLQLLTFMLSTAIALVFVRADVIYTRDPRIARLANWLRPGKVTYEAHQLAVGGVGQRNQRAAVQQVRAVVSVTARLQADLLQLAGDNADANRFIVSHDGVRAARFAELPSQVEARELLGWDQQAFVVGYVGRLHTMTQDKGVGTMIDALVNVPGAHVALVGGPDDMAEEYRQKWIALGLPEERFLYTGQVTPDEVPACMVAFDVCVMPLPFTPHFAYHASPLKLFEYMASGSAVVTTDLPAWADVVQHGHNAMLFPPSDAEALADVLNRLLDDPSLRKRFGEQARQDALAHYTWAARAQVILSHIAAQE
jgi:glycosyltransferase involved in cell wall biosynthesis